MAAKHEEECSELKMNSLLNVSVVSVKTYEKN